MNSFISQHFYCQELSMCVLTNTYMCLLSLVFHTHFDVYSLLIISSETTRITGLSVCRCGVKIIRTLRPKTAGLTSMKLGVCILPVCGHNLQEVDFWSPAPCAAWCSPELKLVGRDDLLWVGCLYTLSLQQLQKLQWSTICYVWLFYRFLILHTT